jgi:glutathione reductase (NADPH)
MGYASEIAATPGSGLHYADPMSDDAEKYDLFVLGAGSGGVRAARVAASLGAKVAICDDGPLGGTCVNVGCIPKKLMVFGAHFAEEQREAAAYGWQVTPATHDFARLMANKDREIARLNGVYQRLLEARGVRIVQGRGRLVAGDTVEVRAADATSTAFHARNILCAVGGRPLRPDFPGAEHVLVSDDVFRLQRRPERLLVIGGGYIAVELAGVFLGYGSRVTLVHRGSLFLNGFDGDVRAHLDREMRGRGVDLRFRRQVTSVERLASGALRVSLDDGETLEVDAVLAAIGRAPRTAELGLDDVGVRTDERGAILVDETFRTSVPGVYAVGDAINRIALTPVALAEGMFVANRLFGAQEGELGYDAVPSAVFSSPPVASVGLTEEEAREAHDAVDIYKSTFTPLKQTLCQSSEKTLMKLVVERRSGRVLGVHMVGNDAPEIVQGFAVAVKCGATKAQFDATLGIHPTAAEELVTLRERSVDPTHDLVAVLEDPPKRRHIVHHRWERGGGAAT